MKTWRKSSDLNEKQTKFEWKFEGITPQTWMKNSSDVNEKQSKFEWEKRLPGPGAGTTAAARRGAQLSAKKGIWMRNSPDLNEKPLGFEWRTAQICVNVCHASKGACGFILSFCCIWGRACDISCLWHLGSASAGLRAIWQHTKCMHVPLEIQTLLREKHCYRGQIFQGWAPGR